MVTVFRSLRSHCSQAVSNARSQLYNLACQWEIELKTDTKIFRYVLVRLTPSRPALRNTYTVTLSDITDNGKPNEKSRTIDEQRLALSWV
jgi:hypothetical protein